MTTKQTENYPNAYNTWSVTTEGDVEGRSVKHLGTYVGYLDDIAFALADQAMYALSFRPADTRVPDITSTRDSVAVKLDIASGTWSRNNDEIAGIFREILKDRPETTVQPGGTYCGVTLKRHVDPDEIKRRNALAKLTPEERTLLGLNPNY